MVSEITRFYCQPDFTSSSVLRQGALHPLFHDGFWNSVHDFLIALYSNFLSGMHGFRENGVLLQAGYNVIVISPPGEALHPLFHDGFSKSDYDFLIAFHSNLLSRLHGFWDNEILLQAWYDVIVISAQGGAARNCFIADSERATQVSY